MAMEAVLSLVNVAGTLAIHCDRSEHNERSDAQSIRTAGQELRGLAVRFSKTSGLDLQALYSSRIERIERRHPAFCISGFDGAQRLREAKTWGDYQAAQYMHDVTYHPDVAGLAKFDQLRHYTLHIAKLAKLALDAKKGGSSDDRWEAFMIERLPDIAIFGIKLATVCGERLPADPISAEVASR